MTITVSTSDPRSVKALAILAGAEQWQRGHTKSGRSFYAIPSQVKAGLFHMADARGCSCRDFQRPWDKRGAGSSGPCKHMLAVRLFLAVQAGLPGRSAA
jgi:SWIM zinc finger